MNQGSATTKAAPGSKPGERQPARGAGGDAQAIAFTIKGEPPKTTAQTHKIAVIKGKPVIYKPAALKKAEEYLTWTLRGHAPRTPMAGPLALTVTWAFRPTGKNKAGEYKATRPDTDNLQKLLKDTMTRAGFWNDDAQVAVEVVSKIWSDSPRISVRIEPATMRA